MHSGLEKPLIVEAKEVTLYLTPGQTLIDVRYADGGLAVTVTPYEAMLLAAEGIVEGIVSKANRLKYLRLVASVRAAWRILKKISKSGRSISAADNYTVTKHVVHSKNGVGIYFEPNGRALAYRRARG